MKNTLKEWAPTLAVLLTGAGLLTAQARSQGRLEAQAIAMNAKVDQLAVVLDTRLGGIEQRVTRLEDWAHTPSPRPTLPNPYDILWPRSAYADTTRPTKIAHPRD